MTENEWMSLDLIYLYVEILQRNSITSSSTEVNTTVCNSSNPLNSVQGILALISVSVSSRQFLHRASVFVCAHVSRYRIIREIYCRCGPGSSVGLATGYGLDGPGIDSQCRRDFPHLSIPALGPTQPPVQWVPGLSRGKEWPGRDADTSPPSSAVVMKEQSYTSTPRMGRTACTEPQCLYKGDLYLYIIFSIHMRDT